MNPILQEDINEEKDQPLDGVYRGRVIELLMKRGASIFTATIDSEMPIKMLRESIVV